MVVQWLSLCHMLRAYIIVPLSCDDKMTIGRQKLVKRANYVLPN